MMSVTLQCPFRGPVLTLRRGRSPSLRMDGWDGLMGRKIKSVFIFFPLWDILHIILNLLFSYQDILGDKLKGSILAPEAAILVFYTASKHQTAFILLYSLKCLRFIDIDSVSSLFLSRSPVLVSVPDVCPPDWPTWVCGVRPPPGPGTSGSLRLRYIITTLTLVTHAS